MHIDDLKALAHRVSIDTEFRGKDEKVYVTAVKDGKKFYMGNGFIEDKRRAFPYRYDSHDVGGQIFQAAMNGMFLGVERVED